MVLRAFKLFLFLINLLGIVACTVTVPRPVQEIANADEALKAARNLHADSLSPDYFRAAAENFYRARKEYRLKNFDLAKKFAMRSIRYSEKAEFDAYQKGGATPEIALNQKSKEGASGDPEESMKHARELQKKNEDEQYRMEMENRDSKTAPYEPAPEKGKPQESPHSDIEGQDNSEFKADNNYSKKDSTNGSGENSKTKANSNEDLQQGPPKQEGQ